MNKILDLFDQIIRVEIDTGRLVLLPKEEYIILRYLDGMHSLKDIAKEMGKPYSVVFPIYDRACYKIGRHFKKKNEEIDRLNKKIIAINTVKEDGAMLGLKDLYLSTRAYNVLVRNGINTVAELIMRSEMDILTLPNSGKKTCWEIIQALREHNLHLKGEIFDNDYVG